MAEENNIIEHTWESFVNIFRRKRVMVVYMIDSQGDVTIFKQKIEGNTFTYKNGLYSIKKKYVYTNKKSHKSMIFYYFGNPEPIPFDHEKNIFMSSDSLYEAIKSDMTKDVFMTTDEMKLLILIILAIVNIVIGIMLLLFAFKVFK